jgi:cytochrome c oxidase subunit 2
MIAGLLLPTRASDIGWSVDLLFWTLVVVCGLVTLGIFAVITIFCIRYREGSPAQRQAKVMRSLWIEITWTSATLLVFLGIFAWGAIIYVRMSRPPPGTKEVHILAKQWMWKAQHPDGRREINELHLRLGEPVALVMTSQDVIHDFSIPAFRTKQDVLPQKYTTEWFTPTKPGKYHLFCSEYCGTDHSRMGGWVYVMEAGPYDRWLSETDAGESAVAAGARLFQGRGCAGCHAPNAAVRAPLLNGIYRRPVALSDGSIVMADEQYLHDSILLPNKQVAAGYQPLMPTYQGQLGEEEVMELIAYLKSLTPTEEPRP